MRLERRTSRRLLPLLLPLLLALLVACQAPVRPVAPETPPAPAGASAGAGAPPPTAEAAPAGPDGQGQAAETTAEAAAPDPIDTGAELFDFITTRLQAPACIDGPANRAWRKRYAGHPASFARHLEKILPLMAYVAAEVDRRGLPAELVFVPIVESWYRPEAIGPGGPAGMWQMITSTARNHGVRVEPGYDGRLSPVASTDAALDYLAALSQRFDGDWRAMAMAYNAGEYRIERAFRANQHRRASGEEREPAGLSNITYQYIAKLRALACLVAEPAAAGLELPREARFVPLARLPLPAGAQTLDQAALALAADAATLRRLNPAYRQGRIRAGVPREVLVPATPATLLAATLRQTEGLGAGSAPELVAVARSHRVRRGDTLSGIARQYGVELRQLYRLNGLDGRSVIHPGQELRLDP